MEAEEELFKLSKCRNQLNLCLILMISEYLNVNDRIRECETSDNWLVY